MDEREGGRNGDLSILNGDQNRPTAIVDRARRDTALDFLRDAVLSYDFEISQFLKCTARGWGFLTGNDSTIQLFR
jgi:hypothetical protein